MWATITPEPEIKRHVKSHKLKKLSEIFNIQAGVICGEDRTGTGLTGNNFT